MTSNADLHINILAAAPCTLERKGLHLTVWLSVRYELHVDVESLYSKVPYPPVSPHGYNTFQMLDHSVSDSTRSTAPCLRSDSHSLLRGKYVVGLFLMDAVTSHVKHHGADWAGKKSKTKRQRSGSYFTSWHQHYITTYRTRPEVSQRQVKRRHGRREVHHRRCVFFIKDNTKKDNSITGDLGGMVRSEPVN